MKREHRGDLERHGAAARDEYGNATRPTRTVARDLAITLQALRQEERHEEFGRVAHERYRIFFPRRTDARAGDILRLTRGAGPRALRLTNVHPTTARWAVVAEAEPSGEKPSEEPQEAP